MARLKGEPAPSDYNLEARRFDGAVIWVNNRPTIIEWLDGPAICTTLVDITERITAEEALKASERRFRQIFENTAEGLFRSNPNGRFVDANPALARLLGYDSPEDLIENVSGMAKQVYENSADRQIVYDLLAAKGILENEEVRWRRKDGTSVWVRISARAIRDDDGRIEMFEGTVVDVDAWHATEFNLVRAKEEAELANRAKSEFLVHMSH